MGYSELFQPRWDIARLVACNLVAAALLVLWLWPAGNAVFTGFDEGLFLLLNQPLAHNSIWLHIWTVGSLRPFDIVVGLILLFLLIKGDWVFKAGQVRAAFFAFFVALITLLVLRAVFSKIIDNTTFQHDSPSMVIANAIKLSNIFPYLEKHWELKDRSSQSFPGDHASVLLIWAMFMSVFSRTLGQRVVIWLLAFLFMMPRLVAGAHWGQDDYIGGVAMALLALGWTLYTPLAARATDLLLRITTPVFRLLGRIPIIRRLSIVRFG